MEYYAKYSFRQKPDSVSSYILKRQEGNVPGLKFSEFKNGDKYIRISVPRNRNMRKYFAYTIETEPSNVLTSVEGLNENYRTFGDARKIGLKDLILFQFSFNLQDVDMYFIHNKAYSIKQKKDAFSIWNIENKLIFEKKY